MPEAGWYTDTEDEDRARWHDGQGWTEHRVVRADHDGPPPPPAAAEPASPEPPVAPPPGTSEPDRDPNRLHGPARRRMVVLTVVLGVIVVGLTAWAVAYGVPGSTKPSAKSTDALGVTHGQPCSTVFADGRPTASVLADNRAGPCIDARGVADTEVVGTYQCIDGTTLAWTEFGWGHIGQPWHAYPAGATAPSPPPTETSSCLGE